MTGEGEGSVKKALADAKAYTDTAVAGKADKATTLAGYGIADAYTKEATDTAIASAIAKADHLKRSIVDALPAVDEADANTIYMVPVDDHYDEYILVVVSEVKKFEKIGDSKVDLSDYATKDEVATAKQAAIDAAATDAQTKADAAQTAAIAEAQKKADAAQAAAIAAAVEKDTATLTSAKEYADGLAQNKIESLQAQVSELKTQNMFCGVPRISPYGYGVVPNFATPCGCGCNGATF